MHQTTSDLLSFTALRADFKSGQTPLGHHWRLSGPEGAEAGRTKRVYQGAGGKLGRRLAVVTGLSTAGSVEIEVLDAGGTHVVTLRSEGGERTVAHLTTPESQAIGSARHDRDAGVVELRDASDRVIGQIVTPPDGDDGPVPFALLDAGGAPIGELSRDPHALVGPALLDMVASFGPNTTSYEAELAKHYGFRSSHTYAVELTASRPLAQPLATLAILSPVLAAYLY